MPKGRGLKESGSDQSESRKGLRYERINRHRGVTFQPHALRSLMKQVDGEIGQCGGHQTSR